MPFLPAITHKSVTSTATKFQMARPIVPGKGSVLFKKKKWCMPICTKCHNFGNNGRNYTKFGAQGNLEAPFETSYFDIGVMSRDLAVTFSVFQELWRKWTLAQKLLGLECVIWRNLNHGSLLWVFLFLALHDLGTWHSANLREPLVSLWHMIELC